MALPTGMPQPSEAYLAATLQPILVPLFIIPIFLITISTGLRLWVKIARTKLGRFAFDDYLMIFGAVRFFPLLLVNKATFFAESELVDLLITRQCVLLSAYGACILVSYRQKV